MVVEEIGAERDAAQQEDGENGCAGADDDGEGGEQPDAAVDGEVAQGGGVGVHLGAPVRSVFCMVFEVLLRERMRRGPSSRSSWAWYSERVLRICGPLR